jgi:hypothetical protein
MNASMPSSHPEAPSGLKQIAANDLDPTMYQRAGWSLETREEMGKIRVLMVYGGKSAEL